jgi:hypothetical protein
MVKIMVTVGLCVCMLLSVSCSNAVSHSSASRKRDTEPQMARDYRVLFVPSLQGGTAGWCLTVVRSAKSGCAIPFVSKGPVVAEGCETSTHPLVIEVYAVVSGKVTSVSVAGGRPIPTRRESSLPDGLRAVFVEIDGQAGQSAPSSERSCPHFTAFDAEGRQMTQSASSRGQLQVLLPRQWEWRGPSRPPYGVCAINDVKGTEFAVRGEDILTKVDAVRGLIVGGFLSCASTEYFEAREDTYLDTAVLLNAARPGADVPSLPGMRHLTGHPGIFSAQGWQGKLLARNLGHAWLVVEEEGGTGVTDALALIEQLDATVQLA